jgi:hypothetical protein
MKFNNKKYTYSKPFGSPRHNWEIVGAKAAIHFSVCTYEERHNLFPACVLEFHYFSPPDYMKDNAPSHVDCKLAGGKCWHDGTSLYAFETLWPLVQPYLKHGEHEAIFRILEMEYENKFPSSVPPSDNEKG